MSAIASEVNKLTEELLTMSTNCKIGLKDPNRSVYTHPDNKTRVIQIGKRLNDIGGMTTLMFVAEAVKNVGHGDEKDLDFAWNGLGSWKS